MLLRWRCSLGFVVAASVLGCTTHERPGEYELAPCTGTELKSVEGEWAVAFANYQDGHKPPDERNIGALHIDAATCRFHFEPNTAKNVQAERSAAAAELPFVATPRGRVELLDRAASKRALRLVTEPSMGELGQTWDAEVRSDRPHYEWMSPLNRPRTRPTFHGSITRGTWMPLPCERGFDDNSPLGGL